MSEPRASYANLTEDKAVYAATLSRKELTESSNPAFSGLKTNDFIYVNSKGDKYDPKDHFLSDLMRSKTYFDDEAFLCSDAGTAFDELKIFLTKKFGSTKAQEFFDFVVPHYYVAANETAMVALDKRVKKLVKDFTGEEEEATDEPFITSKVEENISQFYIGSDGNFHLRQITTNISLKDPADKLGLEGKQFTFNNVEIISDICFDKNGCHFNLDKISAPTAFADSARLVEKLYLGTATDVPFIPKPNIFQRMWNGIKKFANENPYLFAFLVITAIAVTVTIITVFLLLARERYQLLLHLASVLQH